MQAHMHEYNVSAVRSPPAMRVIALTHAFQVDVWVGEDEHVVVHHLQQRGARDDMVMYDI